MRDGELVTVLRGAQVIDSLHEEPLPGNMIVIQGKSIRDVGALEEPPDVDRVIDAAGCTLMPGLIDAHLHVSGFNCLTFGNYRAAQFEVTPQRQAFYALFHAQVCLDMGFTSLRDVGGHKASGPNTREMVAVRDAINAGIVAGPRLLVAGFAYITSAHLDLPLPGAAPREQGATADGPWDLRRMVRRNMRDGCDLIKTCASGGGGTNKEEPDVRNMCQEEISAIADEAHAFKKPCACHCFTAESQKMALRAGVDTLEHCVWTDDEAIQMMLERRTILTTTLLHRTDYAIDSRRRSGTPEFVLAKMKRLQPDTKETFQRLNEAGVRIALGTDTGIDPEIGRNAAEMEIYVRYGMAPMDAIKAGTATAADALGIGDRVGTLEKGKLADIIAVDGDPSVDIGLLQQREKIKLVMKEGDVCVDRLHGRDVTVVSDPEWRERLSVVGALRVLDFSLDTTFAAGASRGSRVLTD